VPCSDVDRLHPVLTPTRIVTPKAINPWILIMGMMPHK